MECPRCNQQNRAEAHFCDGCAFDLQAGDGASVPSPASGERKQATVLFSDLAGYTAMTEKLDPEEVREIMGRIFGEAERLVARYGGAIEKFIGDAVMAVFGVPSAHEDDPVRAVRAARELHQFVVRISPEIEKKTGAPVAMHSGINTGLVVTGGESEGAMGVVGDTVNVASRLCDLAQPGEILLGAQTRLLTERAFSFQALPPARLKGKAEAVEAFRLVAARERPAAAGRLGGLRAGLVGREVELALLQQTTHRLRDGKGSVLSLRGEAGTGKSRLVEEFRRQVAETHQWLAGNAYDHTQAIPYFPLVDLLNHAWSIEEGFSPQQVRERLEAQSREVLGKQAEPHIPYLGALFSLDYPEVANVSPEFRKQKIHEGLLALFLAMARSGPAIFFMEDLHWADPSTVELLRHVLTHFGVPAIVLCIYRPPFTLFPGDGKVPGYREMEIESLSPSLVGDLTSALLEGREAPAELQRFIQEKSGGNPFYVEEVLNSLMETDVLRRENGHWALAGSLDQFNIPPTLQGVIAARLDRLEANDKRLLQEAAVIGRTFLYPVLGKVTTTTQKLESRLGALERTDLIRTLALEPDLEYMFKHPLTQEVVYNSLLIKDRQAIHERVGSVMETLLADRLPEFYERLAHHYQRGQSTLKAVEYLTKAAEKALHSFSLGEADDYYKQAFGLLQGLDEKDQKTWSIIFDLMNSWGLCFYYFARFRGLVALFHPYEQEIEKHGSQSQQGLFLGWIGFSYWSLGQFGDAERYLRRALALAEESKDQRVIAHVCTWLAWCCGDTGNFQGGIGHGERAFEIAQKHLPKEHYPNFKSLSAVAYNYWRLGEAEKGLEACRRVLQYSERESSLRGQVMGKAFTGISLMAAGDFSRALQYFEESAQLAVDPCYTLFPNVYVCMTRLILGDIEGAERVFPIAQQCADEGFEGFRPTVQFLRGVLEMSHGRFGKGLAIIEATEAMGDPGSANQQFWAKLVGTTYQQIALGGETPPLSVMLRNIGFMVTTLPFAARRAERHLTRAIELSKERGVKGTRAEAHLALGQLFAAKKRGAEAKEHLEQAEAIFAETGAYAFLAQTREALAGLG